jgi:chromate transporter
MPFPAIVLAAAHPRRHRRPLRREVFAPGGGHGGGGQGLRPGADRRRHADPPHARFSLAQLPLVLLVGLALWLWRWRCWWRCGGSTTLTQMGWFFTKAALLTFGGAYAVLPYVYQGAVEHYGWLTARR